LLYTAFAAYGRGALKKTDELYERRGSEGIEKFVNWLDDLNEKLKWQLSGIEREYLKCLANECIRVPTEGYKEGRAIDPDIKKVFVPLKLNNQQFDYDENPLDYDGRLPANQLGAEYEERGNLSLERAEIGQHDIWNILSNENYRYRRVLIKAWGGFGKTTLLRHVAYVYYSEPSIPIRYKVGKLIPFLLYLKKSEITKHMNLDTKDPINLPNLITNHYIHSLPGGSKLHFPDNWVKDLLDEGRALILLDGFDEATQNRSTVSKWINKQMSDYPQSTFLLTSRPNAYSEDYALPEILYREFTIEPFTKKQWQSFIKDWYSHQVKYERSKRRKDKVIERDAYSRANDLIEQIEQGAEELQQMATNPLLLKMIATLHYHNYGRERRLPQIQVDLYERIFNLQLEQRPQSRNIPMPLTLKERKGILQRLAIEMVKSNEIILDKQTLLIRLTEYLIDLSISAEEFLLPISNVSELLVEKESDQYEFTHNKFRDYLAAKEIERCNSSHLLVEQGGNSQWKDTTIFYVNIAEDPSNLLQGLVDAGFVRRAYECRKNAAKKEYDDQLQAKLKVLDTRIHKLLHQKLEEYLKQGQWKEADEESYQVMIDVLGKQKGDLFRVEELQDFPCEALLTIDELWVKYSQGKFGFSVQKEIFRKCGYKLDGSTITSEVLTDFMDEVGWRDYTIKIGNFPKKGMYLIMLTGNI